MNDLTMLFNIARPITEVKDNYSWLAAKYALNNYKVITNSELVIKGKDIELPKYIREFIKDQGEVYLFANIINGNISSITMRGVNEKSFMKYKVSKGQFYGIGDLEPDFKYGDLLVLVEGTLDRDACKTYLTRNCLSLMTSTVSNAQAQIISCLTNRVLLLLDNDDVGKHGASITVNKLKRYGVNATKIELSKQIKDLGDLIYRFRNNLDNQMIIDTYKAQIAINGGNVKF